MSTTTSPAPARYTLLCGTCNTFQRPGGFALLNGIYSCRTCNTKEIAPWAEPAKA